MRIIDSGIPVANFNSRNPSFELLKDMVIELKGHNLTVPAGFVSDGASIPPVMCWWDFGLWDIAAIVHDYCYKKGYVIIDGDVRDMDKESSDMLFYDILKGLGVHPLTCKLMYTAVKWFGRYQPEEQELFKF